VQQVRRALGGTVNDVVLAAITGGFRDLLEGRGESVDRALRTLVPVSVRRPGERGTYTNRVSAIFAELPVSIEDPALRLESIGRQMAGLVVRAVRHPGEDALFGAAAVAMKGRRRWTRALRLALLLRFVRRTGPPPVAQWTSVRDLPEPPAQSFRDWG
jgi:hypothetical protein